ncbi:CtsR family transcriptional regulator [Sedimentibacter sp. MB31-C6]|uniref:CtsR family transcriptional regulator n=1 Tax=Sedimentibacter sp. MB31-C6 TaxID=3109366 RepID=UPI002DDCF4FF|nr:CtsR family transcriptional regulator [Sedimentibacter sp. MB36-C1]WSI03336.1 CtsR family transcriptional regulator [Sedimentibacter sp. MB36-C1]
MSNLSDIIEGFIKELMDSNEESAIEIQRNLLAQQFDCSPSQINYVLTTRFNNDRGYIIESRRGGGGYIRIFKVKSSKQDELDKIFGDSIGESITINKALDIIEILADRGIISQREQRIMKRAINDRALKEVSYDNRNKFRADILKEMILALIEQ